MTKKDILNYYRKLLEKSRSFCAICWEKARSFCAVYLNVKRADVFLIAAVIAVLVYVSVNHTCAAVNEPKHIKQRTNVVISSRCGDLFGKDLLNALIQEFEEQHPDLKIQEKAPEAADGDDIVFFDDSDLGSITRDTSLVSLVSFMDIFMYNIDILKAANLDRPPKTRAEFLAAARAVAKSADAGDPDAESVPVSAFALGLSPADPLALRRDFYPWIWANGVDIQSIDLSGDNPALPRPVTDTIAFLGQLNREKLLAPGTFEKTGPQRLREFAEGKIAMMTISERDISFVLDNADGMAFGITALPAVTPGKNRLGLSSIYAGISGDSTVPDEARIFLSFLVNKSDVLAEALGAVPGNYPVVFAGEYIAKNELFSKAWDIFEAADIVEYKSGRPSEETFNRLIREKLAEVLKADASE